MQIQLTLHVNGAPQALEVDPDRTLLSVLRDDLGLTGAKYGCGEGKCGACTVLLDRQPVQACSISAGAAVGSRITTVEGLAHAGKLHPVQAAFVAAGAFQCGYCTPGMIMSTVALLEANPAPSPAEIIHALQDNLCRCGSHPRILAAVAESIARHQTRAETPDLAAPDAPSPVTLDPAILPEEGLFVATPDPDVTLARYGPDAVPPAPETRPLTAIGPYLHIDPQGAITLYVGKTEVGQNTRTTLAQIVAEELRVPVDAVQVIMADTGRVPFDMGTFGSRSMPVTGPQIWRAGATLRRLLLELAAANWQLSPDRLVLEGGEVREITGPRTATLAELARDRQILRIATDADTPTPPDAWQVAGQPAPKQAAATFVTGSHRFAADMALPGMLFGKVLRPPAFNATLESVDVSAAAAQPGVNVVQDGEFVGVVAPDELTATQALAAIRPRWRTQLQVSQAEIFDYLKANPAEVEGRRGPYLNAIGDVRAALASAHRTWRERYTVDYIAHTPLEPRAALAVWDAEGLTVWTGTQRPFGVRAELAAAFDLPETQVRVIVPDTGAGYGGKHAGDAAVEAARLARAVDRPVKVVWTRQEEFTWAYFRPAGLIEVEAGIDREGNITALEFHNYNSGAAGIDTLYTIPHQHIEYHPADSPLRQGAYRALSSTANHFAREALVDEMAHALDMDPLALRLQNLRDERMQAVLIAAAQAFGWGERTPAPGHGFGLAGGFEKGSYVAACVEVQVNPANQQPKVLRVVEAFDCGAVINPDNLRSQVEGAIIQGLGGALFESIKFANGRILNPSFSGYRVPRFADIPTIETVLIDRRDQPTVGGGETPIIAIAPAIANAIFQAAGVRLRALPLTLHGVAR